MPPANGFEGAADCGGREGQQAANVPKGYVFMVVDNSALQMLFIECPPLSAANTPLINQGGSTIGTVKAWPV